MLDGGAGADDAAVVEVLEGLFPDLGDVAGDFFGAQLGVAGVDLELLDVDCGVEVFLHHALGDQDRVLEVVAAPGHVGHDEVAAQGQLAVVGAGAVGEDLALGDVLALLHQWGLVEAGVLVAAGELDQGVDVHPGLDALGLGIILDAHHDAVGVHGLDDAGTAAYHAGAGILGGHVLHAGAHDGGLGADEGHSLALHICAHEGPVGIVVLEEGDEAGGHGDHLLRTHVHEGDLVFGDDLGLAGHTDGDVLVQDGAVLVHADVGLGDDMGILLPSGEVEGMHLGLGGALAGLHELLVLFFEIGQAHHFHVAQLGVAHAGDLGEVDDAAVLHLEVGAFDEAELVDAGVAGQRADEADVRTFRGFDGADAAVVRGVHVAHLEAGAVAAEAARSEG